MHQSAFRYDHVTYIQVRQDGGSCLQYKLQVIAARAGEVKGTSGGLLSLVEPRAERVKPRILWFANPSLFIHLWMHLYFVWICGYSLNIYYNEDRPNYHAPIHCFFPFLKKEFFIMKFINRASYFYDYILSLYIINAAVWNYNYYKTQ